MERILLFDGVCNLCHGFVDFTIRYDEEGTFKFASLQSDVGRELQEKFSLDPDKVDTVVLIEGDEYYTKSTAALKVFRELDGYWFLLYPLIYLPRFVRDAVYDVVARYRYQIFGQKDACPAPDPDLEDRFL
jgi:predicted DCC family thiol-disulfide oxidoreductase YuxK